MAGTLSHLAEPSNVLRKTRTFGRLLDLSLCRFSFPHISLAKTVHGKYIPFYNIVQYNII